MAKKLTEIEGTWEDILEHHEELKGKRVHLTVVDSKSSDLRYPRWMLAKDEKTRDDLKKVAIQKVINRMSQGYVLGGGPYYSSRDELYHDR